MDQVPPIPLKHIRRVLQQDFHSLILLMMADYKETKLKDEEISNFRTKCEDGSQHLTFTSKMTQILNIDLTMNFRKEELY